MQNVENSTGQMTQFLQQINNKGKKEGEGTFSWEIYLYIYTYI